MNNSGKLKLTKNKGKSYQAQKRNSNGGKGVMYLTNGDLVQRMLGQK